MGEIQPSAIPQVGVLRPRNQHNPHDTGHTRGESTEDPAWLPNGTPEGQFDGTGALEIDQDDGSHNTSGVTSPSALQGTLEIEDQPIESDTIFRDKNFSEQRNKGGTTVVVKNAQQLERSSNSSPDSRPDYRDRCLSVRMGSSDTAVEHRRPLVRRGEISPHEPLRVGRGSSCSQNLHKGPGKHPCMPQDGQHGLHSVH